DPARSGPERRAVPASRQPRVGDHLPERRAGSARPLIRVIIPPVDKGAARERDPGVRVRRAAVDRGPPFFGATVPGAAPRTPVVRSRSRLPARPETATALGSRFPANPPRYGIDAWPPRSG